MLATLSQRRSRVQIPPGALCGRDGTVRKPAKRPGSNPGILWVRLPPVLLAVGILGWCSSRRPVKPLPSSCEAEGGRFDSFTTQCRFSMQVRSSIGSGHQPLKLKRRVRFPHGPFWTTRRGAELVDARASEALAPGRGSSNLPSATLTLSRRAGARPGLISSACPARYRGLGLAGGPVLGHVCIPSEAEVRLPDPQLSVLMARYANWHRGHDHPSGGARSLVPVGSTPTRATDRISSRRPAARTPVTHTG